MFCIRPGAAVAVFSGSQHKFHTLFNVKFKSLKAHRSPPPLYLSNQQTGMALLWSAFTISRFACNKPAISNVFKATLLPHPLVRSSPTSPVAPFNLNYIFILLLPSTFLSPLLQQGSGYSPRTNIFKLLSGDNELLTTRSQAVQQRLVLPPGDKLSSPWVCNALRPDYLIYTVCCTP